MGRLAGANGRSSPLACSAGVPSEPARSPISPLASAARAPQVSTGSSTRPRKVRPGGRQSMSNQSA
ncbi:Uncharacterised protein [Bordetella pertussis]|nr:Uncharacterised protein [Bordetella pertussis]CFM11102.1 Uncharacterised protein [Bordetella pertussis]CFM19036.1 Uncharacterised protein [Bordetella pertussis]CFM65187.1 Uncharacterised protein [Bordetella pertussis]CFM90734.1 Uncharacterised protein [Bordetella pertussis]